ncbi:hypothetical protein V1477_016309 [Vespula maculifrons]|uniref:Uncharacterized protein n=1 Tax=Vespula maculifrons TaxID=7453 RepID=A0ABD2BCM9_VESMC
MEEGERFGEDTGWSRRRCPASTRILWTYQAILIVSSGCKPADLIILGFPEPRTYARSALKDIAMGLESGVHFHVLLRDHGDRAEGRKGSNHQTQTQLSSSFSLIKVEAEVVGTLEISGLNRRHGYGTPDLVIFPSQFL